MGRRGHEPSRGRPAVPGGWVGEAGPGGALFAALVLVLAWEMRNHVPLGRDTVGLIIVSALAAGLLTGLLALVSAKISRTRERGAPRASAQAERPAADGEGFWANSPDCLFRIEVRPDGRATLCGLNPAFERLTGLRAHEVAGRHVEDALPWAAGRPGSARWRECLVRGRPVVHRQTLALPTGHRYCRTSLVPIRDAASRRVTHVIGSVADITAKKEVRIRLTRVNAQLQAILSTVGDGYCTLDRQFRLTAANDAALLWLGLDRRSAIGTSWGHVFEPGTARGRAVKRALETQEPVHDELPSLRRPGRWLDCRIYPSPEGISLFFRDVTDARASREAVRQMSREILASQEEERRRIACELHDSTAQHVVAATLNLMRLPAAANEAERQVRSEIEASLRVALQELRVFTYLLHPPGLSRDGLLRTLTSFLDGFGRRAGLATSLRACQALDELPAELQHTVFRVVQEALPNVHKHAQASHVEVCVKVARGALFVRVSDDGIGIREAAGTILDIGNAPVGVGLPGMRARLKQFGGELRVKSVPGRTTLLAAVPFDRSRESELRVA